METPKHTVAFNPDEEFVSLVEQKKMTTIEGFMDNYHKLKEEADEDENEEYGLFYEDNGSIHLKDKSGSDTEINTTIELGSSGKGKLLISCEEGIANTVVELAGDENHLPETKTGVVLYYLVEGLARDFGIAFDRQPVSLGGNRRKNTNSKGITGPSKKEKNEILAKLDLQYYQDDISSGIITMEEAFNKIAEAYKMKEYYESQGFYLSPNKTEGVSTYDWKSAISSNFHANDVSVAEGFDPVKLYTKNKLEVVIPNLWEEFFKDDFIKATKKNCSHLLKSALRTFVINISVVKGALNDTGIAQAQGLKKEADILDFLDHKEKGDIMGIHLIKNKTAGMMKPRWVAIDVLNGGDHVLYLYGPQEEKLTLR
tara:strand:+ start:4402 stop:5511 length:1110 start_codon:yes stop_codon:yes gene_type:complete